MSEDLVVQSIPTTQIIGYWEHEKVGYPDRIKVTMSDGTKVTYAICLPMTPPHTYKPSELARIMKENIFGGYKSPLSDYAGKHEKGRR